jgi:antitoxin MazE
MPKPALTSMLLLCIFFVYTFGETMKTRIQKWGNSLAVRIPKSFAEEMGLGENTPAEMALEEGALLIRPDKDQMWDLDSLLTGVTGQNLHPGWETEDLADETVEDESS